MIGKKIVILICVLVLFISVSCAASELSWSNQTNTPNLLRETIGLPSNIVGNLNPAARNPGLELFCTGLNDVPGGYCNYFADGVPFVNFTYNQNITVSEQKP